MGAGENRDRTDIVSAVLYAAGDAGAVRATPWRVPARLGQKAAAGRTGRWVGVPRAHGAAQAASASGAAPPPRGLRRGVGGCAWRQGTPAARRLTRGWGDTAGGAAGAGRATGGTSDAGVATRWPVRQRGRSGMAGSDRGHVQ
jgi:hypothetical protein